LEDHRAALDALSQALLEKETVEREEILSILGLEDDLEDIVPESVAKHLREPQGAEHNGSDAKETAEVESEPS